MCPFLPIALGIGFLYLLDQETPSEQPQRPARGPTGYGAVPPAPAAMASGSSVLKSAALAPSGSWTRRNVLQQGAASAYQRRLAGTATNADFAVLGAARPGIASGQSGPISGAWSGSPWQPAGASPGPGGTEFDEESDIADSIGDAVLADMGF